ncbi:uncharacterized protein [Rutidosis leptorrhynchoides]|uniref:uncharacterized protein n=1 Tax=Rutidosis leptorrhynchoides TaxID=125765 RepID=UPI003A999C48
MSELRNKVYRGIKGSWRRRGYSYSRLAASIDEFGSKRQSWSWKIRMPRKLKVKLKLKFNPMKLINKVHDGYVRMMMKMANSLMISGGAINMYGGAGINMSQFGMRPMKKHDEKLIIEMYNALVMKHAQLAALEGDRPLHMISSQ